MALSARQISILKDVIAAAKDGRYCHGNGAQWYYVEKGNTKQVIFADHVRSEVKRMTAAESANYLSGNRPHSSDSTVKSLEAFIR
jgi:ribosomal protein L30E